jgi:predicted Zn-dependent protease with MMP-like domain
MRDRHGRGLRVGSSPWRSSRHFEESVRAAVESLEPAWGTKLQGVEFAVADIPDLDQIDSLSVPLAENLISGGSTRIVLYRHPITVRSVDSADVEALILDVLIEQIAELLNLDPEDVDERYGQSD